MRRKWHTLGYIAGFLGVFLALVALLRVNSTHQRLIDVREEMLVVTQGIRQNDIRNLSTRIEALNKDLSKVSGDVRNLTSEVQGARAEVSKVAKDLAALSGKVAAMDSARLEDLARQLDWVTGKLAQVEQSLSRLEGTVHAWAPLAAALEQLGQTVASVQAQVSAWDPEGFRLVEQRLGELEGQLAQIRGRLTSLEGQWAEIKTSLSSSGLRIGVVDAEDLFMRVFLPQVAGERGALQAKAREIQSLQNQYAQGQIQPSLYQQQYAKLQAELLQAQVRVNMSMLEKMLASPGFAEWRLDLQSLRDQIQPLAKQVEGLVTQAQVAILNYADFFGQIQQLQTAFQEVDQVLTQVAAVKILKVAQQVAQDQGCHLVLRTKDVVMYSQTPVVDLTPEVARHLQGLF